MSGFPTVSVIIPAYRAAGTIARAVDSVLAQTVPAAEILIIDDGSPDDLAGAVASYGGRVAYLRQANAGAAAARNHGLDRAKGQFIAFLDADDYWETQKLERQLSVFDRHPQVGLVAGNSFRELCDATAPRKAKPVDKDFDRVLNVARERAFDVATKVWTGTVLARREAISELRFLSGLEPAEDRDLWVRVILKVPVYLISEPLATVVLTDGSLSRTNSDRDCLNMLRVVERYRPQIGERGFRKWSAYVYRRWASVHLAQGRPRQAVRPAVERLKREPLSAEAWWVLGKSCFMSLPSSAATR